MRMVEGMSRGNFAANNYGNDPFLSGTMGGVGAPSSSVASGHGGNWGGMTGAVGQGQQGIANYNPQPQYNPFSAQGAAGINGMAPQGNAYNPFGTNYSGVTPASSPFSTPWATQSYGSNTGHADATNGGFNPTGGQQGGFHPMNWLYGTRGGQAARGVAGMMFPPLGLLSAAGSIYNHFRNRNQNQ